MVKLLSQLGSSIFAEVAQWKRDAVASGIDVIDLGIGSPDRPPSLKVRKALSEAVLQEDQYAYPALKSGLPFRQKAAEWMKHRFSVELDPQLEICTLAGSQDGLAHLAMAIAERGSIALVPDPGYPIYTAALALADVEPYLMPLTEENNYLPQLEAIPEEVLARASFLLLNYPNNPLTAVADYHFFERLVAFAKEKGLLIVHDLAYSEMGYDNLQPPSIMQVPGAKEVAVEFHSLSKSFNMAGCRIGFVVGQQKAVAALTKLKANIDYGVFDPIQEAGIVALDEAMYDEQFVKASEVYQRRRDIFIAALHEVGWNVMPPQATMFVWAKLPELQLACNNSGSVDARSTSNAHKESSNNDASNESSNNDGSSEASNQESSSRVFAKRCLEETGVVVIPGDAFGKQGKGYVRIALVGNESRLQEAARRLGQFVDKYRKI